MFSMLIWILSQVSMTLILYGVVYAIIVKDGLFIIANVINNVTKNVNLWTTPKRNEKFIETCLQFSISFL